MWSPVSPILLCVETVYDLDWFPDAFRARCARPLQISEQQGQRRQLELKYHNSMHWLFLHLVVFARTVLRDRLDVVTELAVLL